MRYRDETLSLNIIRIKLQLKFRQMFTFETNCNRIS